MLVHPASVLAATFVFTIPFIQTCDTPGGEVPVENDTTEPGVECEPEEGEPECRSCLRIACCDGLAACEDDRTCSCVVDCMSDSRVGLEECARTRCDAFDLTAALEPLSRICAIDESCGGPRICEGTQELPLPR
ncbi:hypothetical protein [Nannocystis pusilla]|uniref:Uncharacterized protein n=1 Tax=Nannocystis pusilla TaxID=889268 RepID=A0ABS7TJQ4_9BACT|nr:hypothetical protein [Nannocystis pusilla]MBZ5708456.1 hypothetical protein [Nannocystis pusilla]